MIILGGLLKLKRAATLFSIIFMTTAVFVFASPAAALRCYWSTEVYTYVCDNDDIVAKADKSLSTDLAADAPRDIEADNSIFITPAVNEDTIYGHRYYARLADYTNVYPEPTRNVAPARNVGDGYIFVTVHSWAKNEAGETWYEINLNEYVHEADIRMVTASAFQGVEITSQPQRPFGWIVQEVIPSIAPDVEPDEENGEALPRLTFVQIYDAVLGDEDWLWYDIGNGRWVNQTFMSLVDVDPRPAEVGKNEYWTEIDLFEQTFAAYEGDQMVYAALISTGLNRWPTREGIFQVWDRWEKHKMSGAEGQVDYYFIEDIPYIMYFDKFNGIGLHGTFWHDRFGFKHSHGCVNMSIKDAEWTYWWSDEAPNDLWVYVHTQDPMAHLVEFD